LIPGGNPESERLLLTAQYKKRLTEAFKAMFTEHRETHARQLFQTRAVSVGPSIPKRPERLAPRFRIEPCPSLYLRTARAYAFLQQFLRAAISTESLSRLHGFKEGGLREMTLGGELEAIRLRFYGFYLIACEDIGMAPEFLQGEPINQTEAKQAALKWLNRAPSNVDLACDTRVAVPIYYNTQTNKVRLWVILGVRLAKLNAEYARPPMIRPLNSDQPWEKAKRTELVIAHYMIPVEDFAEIEIDAGRIPNRAELRAICDTHKTKEEIIEALQRR